MADCILTTKVTFLVLQPAAFILEILEEFLQLSWIKNHRNWQIEAVVSSCHSKMSTQIIIQSFHSMCQSLFLGVIPWWHSCSPSCHFRRQSKLSFSAVILCWHFQCAKLSIFIVIPRDLIKAIILNYCSRQSFLAIILCHHSKFFILIFNPLPNFIQSCQFLTWF